MTMQDCLQSRRGIFYIQFGCYVIVYKLLPFGFKASPYIYQTIKRVATSYLRTLSVVTVQYIDGRLGVSGVNSEAEAERDGFKVAYDLFVSGINKVGLYIVAGKMFIDFFNICRVSWFPSGICKTGIYIAR